ncbi:CD1108 family mobile element protein [Faecalibacterium butyricigenerans]
MPIDSGNLALKGLDDLFSTEENRQDEQREQVQQIPIDALHPFTNHPFKVLDDEAMTRTVESIAQYGVLAPLIARPRPDGDGYEIISGHRRQYAAKLAGLDTLPVIVRQMSDDAAVILMVDSNLQREHILPSERAFAYKMKLDAIKNQGARSDLTSTQVAQKLSVEKVGDDAGVSKDTIRRFIRLTNLIPELLDMVDEKKISFNPAVELSYLDESQQRDFLEAMSGFSSCGILFGSGTQVSGQTMYSAEDRDIRGAEQDYKKLEKELDKKIKRTPTNHPGYNEYQYHLDSIEHDPWQLTSFLTTLYDDYTRSEVQGKLKETFKKQYKLTTWVEVQIRYKTVWVISPAGIPVPTQVPYEYKIFHTKLVNKGLEVVIREELNADQWKRYEIFQDTLGGRPYLFNGGLPPGGSDGSGTPGIDYQVPAEALTDSEFAAIYKEAQKYVGTPYVWGGSTPETGFDCSGYVCWVYNQNGYNVGRTTANGLWNKSQHISEAEAKPGDLVFFKGTYDTPGMSHTGIYLGNGMMVSAGDPMERNHADFYPEIQTQDEQAAWELGGKGYLSIQSCEDGWDYTIYHSDYSVMDGGQLNAPELTIQEAREQILEAHHMEKGRRLLQDYDAVMDKVAEAEELSTDHRPSTLEKLAELASNTSAPKSSARSAPEL